MKPAISIVTPTYNRAHLLPRVWTSLLSQTEQRFQWVVVDDGSVDDTARVVAAFNDPRICYVRQDNQGVNPARNRGEREIEADYAIFLDSDDELFNAHTLHEMLDEIRASRDEIAFVSFTVVDRDGQPALSRLPEDRIEATYTDHVCEDRMYGEFFPIYRRDALAISPWPAFNGLESLRHWRIVKLRPTLMLNRPALRCPGLSRRGPVDHSASANRPAQGYQRAQGDNLTGAHSTLRRAPQMAQATSLLIAEHQATWLAHRPSQLGKYRFYRAMYLALSGWAVRALPDAFIALRRGAPPIKAKALLLVATLCLPLSLRRRLFIWRAGLG